MPLCKFCGRTITFIRNKNGNWDPVNADDGQQHFKTCRKETEEARAETRAHLHYSKEGQK